MGDKAVTLKKYLFFKTFFIVIRLPVCMQDGMMTIPTNLMAAERNQNIADTIKAYSQRLMGFIRQRVNSQEDAEDILQDVFYQFAGNVEPIEQVTGWLFKVARNKITDSYRKQKLPLIDDIQKSSADEDGFDWKELMFAGDDSPETMYIRNLFWEELQLALDELPKEQSEVFIQNELEDIPFKTIAERTGVAVATLISRKRYAVLFLRGRLAGLKDELLNY
jgi:RNA polymerase sigma factor (sigma-70 family)